MCYDCHMDDREVQYVTPNYTDKELKKILTDRKKLKKQEKLNEKHNDKIFKQIEILKKELK